MSKKGEIIQCDGQISLFESMPEENNYKPGDWVEKNVLGEKLTFDEIEQETGNLIVIDMSTRSHEWFKVVQVEKIVLVEGNQRRLVYYDGAKQRGLINEMYFDENMPYPARAWRLALNR